MINKKDRKIADRERQAKKLQKISPGKVNSTKNMIRRDTLEKKSLVGCCAGDCKYCFSACSIDLSRLLEEGNNDYDFLNNGVDDVLDTGPVKTVF